MTVTFCLFGAGWGGVSQNTGKKMNWPLHESPLNRQLDAVPVPQFSLKKKPST